MSMFKELMEEQRRVAEKQQKDLLDMVLRHVRGAGMLSTTGEAMSVPNAMAALSNRIDKFVFDPDVDSCFSKWYIRYRAVFVEDGKQLPESARVRLLREKLDAASFEKYQRHVLPKEVSEIGFDETVSTLKQLFDVKTSEFTTRYQCLKLEKKECEDYLTYTGREL
ncbi:unnamed protein product [Heligmosomoides polygyrus]|uniref:Vacuolar protein sorting-associated protein 53 homolog n=1 Tax=Heligmosomoides polygyrus TaxID=6339 RepID=A0A183GXM7_HELPZ|nr:unnamed protein product [Heligmosomoides polygyrus]